MNTQTYLIAMALALGMLSPGSALAQQDTAPTAGASADGATATATAEPPAAAETASPDAAAGEATPATATAEATPGEATPATDQGEHDRLANNRFRFGLEFGAGPVIGDQVGAAIGLVLQLGAQFGRLWHLYYQPSLYIAGFAESSGSTSGDAFVATGQSAMFGLTIKQFLELGIGGGALIGWAGSCDEASATCDGGSEHFPMLNARLAFVIGFKLRNSRLGIPIAAQLQTLFDDSTSVSTLIFTIGIQRY